MAEPASAAERRTATVLYIEDSESSALLVEHVLGRLPEVRLLVAHSAGQALELAHGERCALILTDLNLPDLSGHDLLATLENDAATRGVPICVVSATPPPGPPGSMGVVAHLGKPFRVAELTDVVRTIIGTGAGAVKPVDEAPEAEPSFFERLQASRPDRSAEITRRFITSTGEEMAALRHSVTAGDRARVALIAHRLKGTLGIFGASAAVDRLAELEVTVSRTSNPTASWEGRLISVEVSLAGFVAELERGVPPPGVVENTTEDPSGS